MKIYRVKISQAFEKVFNIVFYREMGGTTTMRCHCTLPSVAGTWGSWCFLALPVRKVNWSSHFRRLV